MADAYARTSGELAVLSVHQGPGFTNALTGLTEAAKSRTPLVALVPEATSPRSNFALAAPGLEGIAAAIGAAFARLARPAEVAAQVADICRAARAGGGQTVVLALPLDVQVMEAEAGEAARGEGVAASAEAAPPGAASAAAAPSSPPVDDAAVAALQLALAEARRTIFLVGRGAVRGGPEARRWLVELAERAGALLAVSAAARGFFAGDPWSLDVAGGFATPLAAELFAQADLVVAWGASLNMWTTRHGRLLGANARIAQIDRDPAALGRHHRCDLPVCGDVLATAHALCLRYCPTARLGWRTSMLAAKLAAAGRWRDVPYTDDSTDADDGDAAGVRAAPSARAGAAARIDPRTFSIALDDALPAARTVVIDSGNFMGYPSMFLDVPDAAGFCFTQAFQSVGLGLASAIGAALARPDRVTLAALGDGGFLMSAVELVTAVRLRLPLVIVVYNDAAYGAEVHHFGPHGHPLDAVTFPDTDLAALARGYGCAAATVRRRADLAPLHAWLAGPRDRPLVLDAKITSARASWWLEEAFRGH